MVATTAGTANAASAVAIGKRPSGRKLGIKPTEVGTEMAADERFERAKLLAGTGAGAGQSGLPPASSEEQTSAGIQRAPYLGRVVGRHPRRLRGVDLHPVKASIIREHERGRRTSGLFGVLDVDQAVDTWTTACWESKKWNESGPTGNLLNEICVQAWPPSGICTECPAPSRCHSDHRHQALVSANNAGSPPVCQKTTGPSLSSLGSPVLPRRPVPWPYTQDRLECPRFSLRATSRPGHQAWGIAYRIL